MKTLCVGHVAYDITLETNGHPEENLRNEIVNTYECGGGSIANSAYLLSLWQEEVYIAGVIGYDSFSNKIKKEFNNVGVKNDFLVTDYDNKTSTSYVLLNNENGNRTILSQKSNLPALKIGDYHNIMFDNILLDGYEYTASIKVLRDFPAAMSILDIGRVNKEALELCTKVNIIICSKEFAEEVSGIKITEDTKSMLDLYLDLKKRFIKQEIIVTLEEKGVLYSYNNEIKVMPSLKVEVKDPTGAGDIFHGAFSYWYTKTKDIEKSVKFANVTAGLSLQHIGVKNSYPTLEEVQAMYEKL